MWISDESDEHTNPDPDTFYDSVVGSVLTGAVAVTTDDGRVKVWTAYLAQEGERLWLTSQAATEHTRIIGSARPVGVSIWVPPERWGDPLEGVQIEGHIAPVTTEMEAEIGLAALHRKYPGTLETLPCVDKVVGPARTTGLFEITAERATLTNFVGWDRAHHRFRWSA